MAKKKVEPKVIKASAINPKRGRRGRTLAEAMIEHPDPQHRWERPLQAPGRDRKSTRLNSNHSQQSRMPSSA